jgi:uncharacterized protein YacL
MKANLLLIRIVFTLLLVTAGWLIEPIPSAFGLTAAANSAIVAFLISLVIFYLELHIRQASLKTLIGSAVGLILGVIAAAIPGFLITAQDWSASVESFIIVTLMIFMAYVGMLTGSARGEHLDLSALGGLLKDRSSTRQHFKVLDTSVIIDGRVADIAETGFLDGTIVVPQFVLRELQQIADSSDSARRNRGRRGLDILQRVQKMNGLDVQIVETDFPNVREVDLKLIELAKQLQCPIVTNDFNLNKVAHLRGVEVLNINELANALKPVVLPGEIMRVFILKEGKEYNQGVAYLDDGTMVVVDNARRLLGKNVDMTVTSVLQTTAGKMIFGRADENQKEASRDGRESRSDAREHRDPREVRDPRDFRPPRTSPSAVES